MRTAFASDVVALLVVVAVLGGCNSSEYANDDAKLRDVFRFEDVSALEQKRVKRGDEWRDVRVVPKGISEFSCATIPKNGVFRLAYTAQLATDRLPRAEVFVGEQRIAQLEATDPMRFATMHVDLTPYDPALGTRVRFDSESDVYLAMCALTSGLQNALDGASPTTNVLIFLVDTLRPDHLGCYGYSRATSPNVDALAADGVLLEVAISQSSWTRPAVASLLTSTYAEVHGAQDRADIMRQDLATIESALNSRGFETQGFMSNATCLPMWGIGEDFSRYVDIASYNVTGGKDAVVVDAAIAALRETTIAPWFFYVHAIDPHAPYEPPAPYDTQFKTELDGLSNESRERIATIDLYDGEIAFTDAQFGRLMQELKNLGVYDNTLIVFLSDHGEEFWEHGGLGHGSSLYDEQIRIPCIVKLPQSAHAGSRYGGVTEIVDIAPTILDLLGIAPPATFQGKSLRTALSKPELLDAIAYASLRLSTFAMESARNKHGKYVRDISKGTGQWFDLVADPAERNPLLSPPEFGVTLERHTDRIVSSGKQGLRIMVTGSLNERHTITGTVHGTTLGEPHLRYAADNGFIKRIDGGIEFTINTWPGPGAPPDIKEWHERVAEQNNAHITIPADLASPFTISLTLDGAPAPESMIFVGSKHENKALHGSIITPQEILARPEVFDPLRLPRRLAVYVWYVPPVESISDTELEPGMADALKAMGYL